MGEITTTTKNQVMGSGPEGFSPKWGRVLL
jgi:hypothetical protein